MTSAEFDQKLRSGELRLAFVGMSNAGKTTRSKALESALDFTHVDIDAEICKELGVATMDELAAWLGYPDSKVYHERESRYLELEEKHTAKKRDLAGNIILDTTGSIVHVGKETQQELRSTYFVVHLDVGDDALADLATRFFAVPKPVVWGDYFSSDDAISTTEALARSYPRLLRERLARFRSLAHLNVPSAAIALSDGHAIVEDI